MARPRKKKPLTDHLLIREEPKTELQKAVAHLEENYKIYIAGAIFLILCIAIGVLIRVSATINERERATRYAEAALVTEPEERLEKYNAAINALGRWTPEALYRKGETAIQAEEYDVAEETFNRLINDYPNSDYIVNAVDALAFIAWNRGDLEAALEGFERVTQDWPGEFIARRKHYDIGRVLEEMERFEDAVAAYQQQLQVFPDSAIARRAQAALDELAEEHPDLVPQEGEDDLFGLELDDVSFDDSPPVTDDDREQEGETVAGADDEDAADDDATEPEEADEAAVDEPLAEDDTAETPTADDGDGDTTDADATEPEEADEAAADEPLAEDDIAETPTAEDGARDNSEVSSDNAAENETPEE